MRDNNSKKGFKPKGKIHFFPNIKTLAVELDHYEENLTKKLRENGFYFDHTIKKNKKRENFRDIPFLLSLKDFIHTESFKEYIKIHESKIEALSCHNKNSHKDVLYPETNLTPRNSQLSALRFLRANKGNCILGDEHGAGKTLPALLYFYEEKTPTLILCSKNLVETWRSEIGRIFFNGEQLLDKKFFVRSWDSRQDEIVDNSSKFGGVIIDESHNLEDISSERFKFALRVIKKVGRVTLLTGKQISRWPLGFYSQLKLLGIDITKERYLRSFFHTDFVNNRVVVKELREGPLKFFISLFYIRRTLLDVAPEVKTNSQIRKIMPSDEELRFIKRAIKARGHILSGIKVIELNKMISSVKVKGAIELVQEILKQNPEEKICICSQFSENFELLKKYFKSIFKYPTNEQIVFLDTSDFREGINLQSYQKVIFLDVYVDRTKNTQIKKRFERIGSSFVNFYFLSSDSLDQAILTMPHFTDHRIATQYLEKWITTNLSLESDIELKQAS